MMFSILSGNEKSNTGQSDRSNRMIWGFLLARAVFPGHSMTGQQTEIELILRGRFSFVRCEKHSDMFRTREKSRRELQQLVQNTILSTKCSRQYFLSDCADSQGYSEHDHRLLHGRRLPDFCL